MKLSSSLTTGQIKKLKKQIKRLKGEHKEAKAVHKKCEARYRKRWKKLMTELRPLKESVVESKAERKKARQKYKKAKRRLKLAFTPIAVPKKDTVSSAPGMQMANPVEKSNLKKIEGIGPKIEQLFFEAGILSFDQLAKAKVENLRKILYDAGSRYRMHNPGTWPEQAALARDNNWGELSNLKKKLKGGK